jgi:hypothetical protein
MRRWWPVAALLALAGSVLLIRAGFWRGGEAARPLPVPGGDHEVAWLHIPTSGESWENFVWGMKRAEMAASGAPGGLRVDDSAAFPARTTAVPEIVVSRDGFAGRLRVRWYKVTNYAPTDAWVKALAARNPAPLAVVGGWSSDRAKELALAMADAPWPGQKPVLMLAQATADAVYPDVENYSPDYQPPRLIDLYPRSYRFCFTNRQMADAVADFVLTDPALRPGPAVTPGLRAVPAAAGGIPGLLPRLVAMRAEPPGVAAVARALCGTPRNPAVAGGG